MRINHQNAKEIKKNYLYINMKLKKIINLSLGITPIKFRRLN